MDPDTCALGQWSVSVTLTAASITKGVTCLNPDGTAKPYIILSMGDKRFRTKTKNGTFPAFLETYQFGCQDPETPVAVSLINEGKAQVPCVSSSLENWKYGREAVIENGLSTGTGMKKQGFGLIKDVMQSYPYVVQRSGSSIDLTITALPGPQEQASKWNVHTSGDIVGIVAGMMAFLLLIGCFIYKIRQSSAGPAVTETNPTSAATGAVQLEEGKKNRKSDRGKLAGQENISKVAINVKKGDKLSTKKGVPSA